ncbi:MAG: Zn-ribbon domain-containing OB-fold protein [Janthinobacterium lividum]
MNLPIIEVARKRAYPPRVSAFTQPFWDALSQGRFITTVCTRCGKPAFVPKPICPHCWCDKVEWQDLSTHGVLYSWTRVHAAPAAFVEEAPFPVGIIDLDINLRLACRLVESGKGEFVPGKPMEMVVLKYQDGPMFAARQV